MLLEVTVMLFTAIGCISDDIFRPLLSKTGKPFGMKDKRIGLTCPLMDGVIDNALIFTALYNVIDRQSLTIFHAPKGCIWIYFGVDVH